MFDYVCNTYVQGSYALPFNGMMYVAKIKSSWGTDIIILLKVHRITLIKKIKEVTLCEQH